jgi:Ca-activated chloride channel homolog
MRILIFSFLLLTLSFAYSQEIQEQVEVELVQVDLVATDSKGNLITDLTQDDFVVKEDGKVQTIKNFFNASKDEISFPLTMSFVVDTSGSMQEQVAGMTRIDIAVRAAEIVLSQLRPDDQVELIEFNKEPVEVASFTPDGQIIQSKLKGLTFQKASTAMHDAMIFAMDKMKSKVGRKIIVIFSDGMDTSSKAVEEDVLDAIRKSDATIITFYSEFSRLNFPAAGGGLAGSPARIQIRAGEDILTEYAQLSGGQFFSFQKEPELLKAIEAFRAFVRSQYTLTYTPPIHKKAGWRKIKVECKRKDIQLRHREAYWAEKTPVTVSTKNP